MHIGLDGRVRSADMEYKIPGESKFRVTNRPIHKLALMVPEEEQTMEELKIRRKRGKGRQYTGKPRDDNKRESSDKEGAAMEGATCQWAQIMERLKKVTRKGRVWEKLLRRKGNQRSKKRARKHP